MNEPRSRATAIVVREGKILLVRDRDRPSFALPGGGVYPGELPIVAVARELHEETTLRATSILYLFQHGGKHNTHHVFRVEAEGDVSVAGDEHVEEFAWWDTRAEIPVYPHVLEILKRSGDCASGERVRRRATAIVMREGKVLLLREPADTDFHIPGGGVTQDETPISAVVRELQEETGLVPTKIEFLFSYREYWGENGTDYSEQSHSVYRVETEGDILLGPEIEEYAWWDRASELPLREYVRPLLDMLRGS